MSTRTYHFGTHAWRGECRVSNSGVLEQIFQYGYAALVTLLVFGVAYDNPGMSGETTALMVGFGVLGILLIFGIRVEYLKVGPIEFQQGSNPRGRARANDGEDAPEEWREQNR